MNRPTDNEIAQQGDKIVLTHVYTRALNEFLIHNWTRLGANPGPDTHQSVTLSTYPPRS